MTNSGPLKVLIVEDEAVLSLSLEFLLHAHGGYRVVGKANDLAGTIAVVLNERPDVALVDIRLARGASGLDVAAELQARGIPCLFMTGNAPDKPQPDLMVGVLSKPFSDEALFSSLDAAGQIIRGKRPAESELPPELKLY